MASADARAKVDLGPELFTVSGMLTAEECAELIARGEEFSYERATVRMRSGAAMRPEIRDNDRAVMVDQGLADDLWARSRPFVPENLEGGTAVGLGAEFRYYRYEPGQRFKRHIDGVIERSPDVRSRLTCLIYLNDGFEGGETAFYSFEKTDGVRPEFRSVSPEAGAALFFRHEWWHEGRAVTSGRKYVLRTDVFYSFADGERSPAALGGDR